MKKDLIIDQRLDIISRNNLGANINEGFPYAGQVFTAGITGLLVGVSVHIRSKRSMNPNRGFDFFNLRISIYSVENGFPKDELTSIVLNKDESTIEEIIELPTPIKQKKDEQYAILANYPNGPKCGAGQWLGNWEGITDNQYQQGNLVFGNIDSWFISSVNYHDVFFRTYVSKERVGN